MRSTRRTVRVQSGCIDAGAWRSDGHDQPGAVFDEVKDGRFLAPWLAEGVASRQLTCAMRCGPQAIAPGLLTSR
jgi:hypothetical protein